MADKEVSVNIKSLPTYAVGTILEKIKIDNSVVLYDRKTDNYEIFILPLGKDIAKFTGGKSVIRSGSFVSGRHITHVKGKEIVFTTKGKDNIPIRYMGYI